MQSVYITDSEAVDFIRIPIERNTAITLAYLLQFFAPEYILNNPTSEMATLDATG